MGLEITKHLSFWEIIGMEIPNFTKNVILTKFPKKHSVFYNPWEQKTTIPLGSV
jgi:hypothetical protein